MSNTDTTPLVEATKAEDIVECRRLIESEGADIHQRDSMGFSPIIWGSMHGHLDICTLLLSKGANIHDKSRIGWSSISIASAYGHIRIVDLLLSKGASLQDTNKGGKTCFTYARNSNYNPKPLP